MGKSRKRTRKSTSSRKDINEEQISKRAGEFIRSDALNSFYHSANFKSTIPPQQKKGVPIPPEEKWTQTPQGMSSTQLNKLKELFNHFGQDNEFYDKKWEWNYTNGDILHISKDFKTELFNKIGSHPRFMGILHARIKTHVYYTYPYQDACRILDAFFNASEEKQEIYKYYMEKEQTLLDTYSYMLCHLLYTEYSCYLCVYKHPEYKGTVIMIAGNGSFFTQIKQIIQQKLHEELSQYTHTNED